MVYNHIIPNILIQSHKLSYMRGRQNISGIMRKMVVSKVITFCK